MNAKAPRAPFFVYGTLLPSQPNERLWKGRLERTEDAWLPAACLFDMGHFPMLILTPGQPQNLVRGMLLHPQPTHYQELLSRFDKLEGYTPDSSSDSPYTRETRRVVLGTGNEVNAMVYIGSRRYVVGRERIPTGYWPGYASSKAAAVVEWWASFETLFPDDTPSSSARYRRSGDASGSHPDFGDDSSHDQPSKSEEGIS